MWTRVGCMGGADTKLDKLKKWDSYYYVKWSVESESENCF